jgi:hypothetical protein
LVIKQYGEDSEPPFERRAIETLMQGLGTLQQVALETEKKGTFYFERFQEVVSEGVSANLCEAVIGGKSEDGATYKPLVSGIIEGRKYKVKIELSESDYEIAVLAHQTWNEISCLGELIKEGNYYRSKKSDFLKKSDF